MPDTPQVSIVDPGGGSERPLDVLVGGEARAPRIPRRWKITAIVVVSLLAGGVVVVRSLAEQRVEQRAQDAAFARADEVHLRGRSGPVYGFASDAARVVAAEVEVSALGGDRGGDRVTGVRFEGEGLTPRPPDLSGLVSLPATLRAEADVDCGRVAAGRYPERVSVVLDVVPRSGVVHSQRMPVPAGALREASLQACDLPDPAGRTRVEVQGAADGRALLLFVEPVPRSKLELVLEAVRIPGFDVRRQGPDQLPTRLPSGAGGFFPFDVRVVDCGRARGSSSVAVDLKVGGTRERRLASAEISQPQPDSVPATQLLQRLVDAAC